MERKPGETSTTSIFLMTFTASDLPPTILDHLVEEIFGEDANIKVKAEGAVRDKQFDNAADFYAKALKIAPWWPTGHFNRSLVLGETGDYGEAKREMKYYLQLVQDAPNARAAQDKIYDWERKAGEGK